ncbi:dephospho-CoA kinase [Ruegeria sp. AD91A]|uniref:dephospho-CoA kinase n=1 Tax=Ruegeria sp. AD91A TaxID=2293862 RepID=UPI000E53FFF7|nr:dephospho-CoA kinase [Ruegeria sp. AD91A]AXT27708.1 dephospho-CoA kinase [Ruegeria sp. AD91A]
MSFALGLTGSIGMGKSTTAQMFVEEGCALWDADAAVHRLYSKGGAAVGPMERTFSSSILEGAVNRDALKRIIAADPAALKTIEAIVHPLVAADRAAFREAATNDILVFDIPLLFETGGDAAMDAVACVSIPASEQKRRVMERGTMTETQFEQIREKQMPNDEKCARSDYVIVTDTLDHARAQVQDVVRQIRAGMANA